MIPRPNSIGYEVFSARSALAPKANPVVNTISELHPRTGGTSQDRARAKILTNRFSEIADKARLEAEVSRAVAKDMLNRDDQEKPT